MSLNEYKALFFGWIERKAFFLRHCDLPYYFIRAAVFIEIKAHRRKLKYLYL